MPNLKPDYSQLISAHAATVRTLAQNNARYEYEGAGNRSTDKMLVKGMTASHHEFQARLESVEDLIVVDNQGSSVTQKAIQNSAFLGHHVFGLTYDSDAHQWTCTAQDPSAPYHQRAKTFYDRLFRGEMNSFPKTDTALVALSHGLPLDLWEAESFAAFEQFSDLERQRRRGTEAIKPLLAFQPIDYLFAIAQETTALEVYDNLEKAADKGLWSACMELGKMPPLTGKPDVRMPGRVEAPRLTVRPGAPLWFRMVPPVGYQEAQALLLFVSNETVEDDSVTRRRVFLLSTHSAHNGTAQLNSAFDVPMFESPLVQKTNCTLDKDDTGELVVMFARSGDLGSEAFFQRTRSGDSDIELNGADLRDLQRAVLRRGPDQRHIYTRRIAVANVH